MLPWHWMRTQTNKLIGKYENIPAPGQILCDNPGLIAWVWVGTSWSKGRDGIGDDRRITVITSFTLLRHCACAQ